VSLPAAPAQNLDRDLVLRAQFTIGRQSHLAPGTSKERYFPKLYGGESA